MLKLNPKISMNISHIAMLTLRGLLFTALVLMMTPGLNSPGLFPRPQEAQAQAYNIRPEHPRVILTAEKMQQIMAKVQANDPDWQALYQRRAAYMTGNLPYGVDSFYAKWAILYKVTNDPVYLNRIREGLFTKDNLNAFNYKSRNGFRASGWQYIELYDWLYYDWTPEERVAFQNKIIEWFNYWRAYVKYDLNFVGYRWSDSDESKSLALNFLLMGIVLYGDYPDAAVSIDIGQAMYRYIEDNWWPRMGGVFVEGSYYGPETRSYALEYLLVQKTALGIDPSAASLSMLKETANFLIYGTDPDNYWSYSFGDIQEPQVYGSINKSKHRAYFGLKLLELLKRTEQAGYLRRWLDFFDLPFRTGSTDVVSMEMLYNDRTAAPVSYADFPLGHYFIENKMFLSRSSWSNATDTVWWGFQSARPFVDHMTQDMLSYQIMRGKDFVSKEINGYSGASGQGRAHNTVLVKNQQENYSGGGYAYTAGECAIKNYVADSNYTYISVDASLAYRSDNIYWKSSAEKVMRKFLYLKPGRFVVLDYVKTKDIEGNTAHKAVTNHYMHEPVIDADMISSYEGNSAIFVKYLLPKPEDLRITPFNEILLFPGTPDNQYNMPDVQKKWQTLAESISNPPLVRFLHVVEVGGLNLTQMAPAALVTSTTNNMVGSHFADQVVLFSNDIAKNQLNETISYAVCGSGVSRHLIFDLNPNTRFDLCLGDQTRSLSSSAQGVLSYDIFLSGDTQITIIPQGSAPQILYGDVSGDGQVSMYDAALAAQHAIGLITLTAEQLERADVSGDGKVTMYDAALIAQRALGLIAKFPVEG